jgi:hypothetical protein
LYLGEPSFKSKMIVFMFILLTCLFFCYCHFFYVSFDYIIHCEEWNAVIEKMGGED